MGKNKYAEKQLKPLNRAALIELLDKEGMTYSDKLSNAELRALLLSIEYKFESEIETVTEEISETQAEQETLEGSEQSNTSVLDLINSRRATIKSGVKSEGTIISDVINKRRAGKGSPVGRSIAQIIAERKASK